MKTEEEIRQRIKIVEHELERENKLLGGPVPVTTPKTYKLENEIDALWWVLNE